MGTDLSSELLTYLARNAYPPGTRLPAIQELSHTLAISTGKLREQLEVARQLGLVEVRPKTGIRTLEFSFSRMIKTGLSYALTLDPNFFFQFGILRNNVEAAFWYEAVRLLQLRAVVPNQLPGDSVFPAQQRHCALHNISGCHLHKYFG